MNRPSLSLAFLPLCLFFSLAVASADEPSSLPNVVLFLVDDLGWMDLGCQGSDLYETPHLDQLAASGIRFTDGYAACAVCSPTRAAVQTGRDPARLGVTDWIRSRFQGGAIPADGVNPSNFYTAGNKTRMAVPKNALWMESGEVTLAELLEAKGYHTCYIGKWHLGTDPWYPTEQGYDRNIGGCDYGQPPSFFDPYNQPKHRHEMIRAGIPGIPGIKAGDYLTDRETDEAIDWLNTTRSGDSDDAPFFLMVANYAVHTPIQARADLTKKYQDILDARSAKPKQRNAKYAGMVESVDTGVGRIMAWLDETKQADNTLVIFTSDNGGLDRVTDNAPLRSGKGYAFEGGIRVPWIVRWPGVTPPGSVSDVPVTSTDIFPTLAAATGQTVEQELDGIDLIPALKGGTLKRDTLTWHFPHYRHNPGPYSIIRKGDWKLIKWWAIDAYDLFDLANDLSETTDLAEEKPKKVEALNKDLLAELKRIGAKLPKWP